MKKCKSFVASKIGVGRPARGLASNDLPTLEATQSPFALLVTDFTINPPFDEYEDLTIYTPFLHLQVTARKALTASRLYIHLRLEAPDLGVDETSDPTHQTFPGLLLSQPHLLDGNLQGW